MRNIVAVSCLLALLCALESPAQQCSDPKRVLLGNVVGTVFFKDKSAAGKEVIYYFATGGPVRNDASGSFNLVVASLPHVSTPFMPLQTGGHIGHGQFAIDVLAGVKNAYVVGKFQLNDTANELNMALGEHRFNPTDYLFGRSSKPIDTFTACTALIPPPADPGDLRMGTDPGVLNVGKLGNIPSVGPVNRQTQVKVSLVSAPSFHSGKWAVDFQSRREIRNADVRIVVEDKGSNVIRNAQVFEEPLDSPDVSELRPLKVNDKNPARLRFGDYFMEVDAEGFIPGVFVVSVSPNIIAISDSEGNTSQVKVNHGETPRLALHLELSEPPMSAPTENSAITRLTSFPVAYAESLPLPGWRSPDSLALLLPGVAPAPLAVDGQIPAIAPGIGSAGQFSINGLRGQDSSFLNDGSDNNDEDLGVRRQGVIAPFPQPIESLAEFTVVKAFANATYGRGIAGFLDTRSEFAGMRYHGSAWEFATGEPLEATNFFDVKNSAYPAGQSQQQLPITSDGTLTGQPVMFDVAGSAVPLPFQVQNGSGFQANPTAQNDQSLHSQGGFFLNGPLGPLGRHGTMFAISYERRTQRQAEKENFVLPTAVQRQICNPSQLDCPSYVFRGGTVYPVSFRGDALWSLFPFPNNPLGPFGANTYTEELRADGDGNVYMGEVEQQIKKIAWLLLRYNGSNERSIVPETGEALFSSVKPYVFTQNAALIFASTFGSAWTNTARASYGDSRAHFDEVRDPYLSPESPGVGFSAGTPFLLNTPLLLNSSPGTSQSPQYTVAASTDGIAMLNANSGVCVETVTGSCAGTVWSDQVDIATLGQISVSGFSPVGADVYNFPQQRANYTFQLADTLTAILGGQQFAFGFDLRQVALNSIVAANYRPTADYHGLEDYGPGCSTAPCLGAAPLALNATTAVSLAEAQASQTFAVVPSGQSPNYALRLRALQAEFFFQDEFTLAEKFHVVAGLRFQKANLPQDTGYFAAAFNQQDRQSLIDDASNACAMNANPNNTAAICSLGNVLNQLLPSSLASAFDPNPYGLDARLGFAWNVSSDKRTILRGGFGTYTGQFAAIIAEESRNAFPSFLSFSGGINTSLGRSYAGGIGAVDGVIYAPNAIQALAGIANDIGSNSILAGITYPGAPRHPSSIQQNLTFQRQFGNDSVFTISYVGTEGRHLLDVSTPLGGLSRSFENTNASAGNLICVSLCNFPLPGGSNGFFEQPIQYQGMSTPWIIGAKVYGTAASSSYNSLQAGITKHVSTWFQATSGLTWSHAIDNASDYTNLAGSFAFPQNSVNPSERGPSNFDVRFRSVTHFLIESPRVSNWLIRDWLLSGILTFQSGQPYTINTSIDVNEEGNATERLNNLSCLVRSSSSRVQWQVSNSSSCLSAPGQDGSVGRNSFRGWAFSDVDFALGRSIPVRAGQAIQLRAEAYNSLNHPNFGIPNRILESPAFGKAMTSVAPPRTIQFAARYTF